MRKLTAILFLLLSVGLRAQQLQTQSPPQPANVKYSNGVSPGYALTKGTGLTLNISAGTAQCVDQLAEYAGGTKTLTDNIINYVYLDPAQDCAVTVNTTGFLQGTVWIGKVTTASGSISSITDDVRTPFAVSKVALTGGGGTGGGTNNQGTVALSGCGVAWTGNLTFLVSSCTYLIAGTQYTSPQASLALGTADATYDRIDVIAVDNTGTAIIIPGTPASSPLEPAVDPATQLRITVADVAALATSPTGVSTTNLYLENTEWTCAASSNFNCASTSNPFAGTKDVEATTAIAGNYVTLTKPSSTVDLSTYSNLVLYIRSKAAWANAKSLSLFWLNGSTVVGASVSVKTGNFGFSSSVTGTYQQVVIPIGNFATGTNPVNKLQISVAGGGGSIGFYADNISIQSGVTGSGGGPQTFTISVTSPISGGGTAPLGGTLNLSCPTCGTGTGTVTSVATTSPITGGTITSTGTIACATCAIGPGSSTINHLAKFSGTDGLTLADGGAIPSAYTLPTQYALLHCEGGLGDGLNAIPAGTYVALNCHNNSAVTWTITGISCFTDNTGSSTLAATNNAASALLTGAVTCTAVKSTGGAPGTQSGTTTLAAGDGITFSFISDGATKTTTWFVKMTQ